MATQAPTVQPFDFAKDDITGKARGLWRQAFARLVRNRLAIVSGVLLSVIALVATLADITKIVSRHDPAEQQYTCVNCEPAWLPGFLESGSQPALRPGEDPTDLNPSAPGGFWLGTDNLGRDTWSRLLQGTLFSLKVGLGTQIAILAIGLTVGMGAALAGKLSDTILMWVTDLTYAFPDLLAIILLRQILFGRDIPIIGEGDPQLPGLPGVLLATILAIALTSWVTVARLVRGQMLTIKELDYTLAARAMGASEWRIIRVHMLPNTLGAIIVSVTFGIPLAIFAEAALSFIGLGVPAPNASLGSLISDGQGFLRVNQWMIIWPSIMVATLMLCFTFLGDGLRDALDPRTRK